MCPDKAMDGAALKEEPPLMYDAGANTVPGRTSAMPRQRLPFGISPVLYGTAMAFFVSLQWGILPVLLKFAGDALPTLFVVWARFAVAFALLLPLLQLQGRRPLVFLRTRPPVLALAAGLLLGCNYYTILLALRYAGPAQVGVLVQAGPLLLALAGVFLFGERFTRIQAIGLVVAVSAFACFQTDLYFAAARPSFTFWGTLYTLIAAVAWVFFAVCQKKLCRAFDLQLVNLLVFGFSAVLFSASLPLPEAVPDLRLILLLLLLGAITLCGYGAMAEAIRTIPASRLSVILALNPLVTVAAGQAASAAGLLAAERISGAGYTAALIAVMGVCLVLGTGSGITPGETA